ncbi:dihydroorotate dehydrogenase electron transfer subunit [Candidatus Bathyarchaeota archaeon]|nr:MAG: dihydroorotate dehydrogenase electron transfer subunit [Candidatus Bathyarchaeota archaeon]HDD69495.1 dihydroorotate dehydrogenase electron transfer subunit [Candidatus Bathyarchaeota archaeon]
MNIKTESPTVKTFTFKDKQCAKAKPGQFLMLWIPGIDEIPLSILDADKNGTVSVAVKKVGEATKALHELKAGETIGVRGPFGNSFTVKKGKILMVGGGTGLAPLLFLAKKLALEKAKIFMVMGAKTREELLFKEVFEKICGKENLVATTEDGSYGVKGLATTPLERILAKEKLDIIYTCGPEKMMRKVFDLAETRGIAVEASLERLMRCAIGLCGSCVIGKYRVCRDGPVFTVNQLREVKGEFGVSKRDFDGKLIPLG